MKSLIIDESLHYKLKIYCKGKNLKIGGLVENMIKAYLEDPKTFNNLIEKLNNK
jgi:hypothetical protein